MKTLVEVKELVLSYDGRRLHPKPLDFRLPEGKITVLIGPNGSGKTTLLRALLKDISYNSGAISLDGRPLEQFSTKELSDYLGFVSQEQAHFSDHRVFETLSTAYFSSLGLFGRLSAVQIQEIKARAAEMRLTEYLHRPIARLSQGERQRVFLLRSILKRPRLLLLDEPTNHLDPGAAELFWRELKALRTQLPELSVLASTHDLLWARTHSDEVLALSFEGIVYQGESKSTDWEELTNRLYCFRTTS